MKAPLVSVITPAFNSEKFIAETIRSVQNQTFPDWELLIVDDCSSDKTVAIVAAFAENDPRIQLIQLQKNSGTGIARNTAVAKASGKYIAFLDADDLWKPEKLEKQIGFIKTHRLPFTFSFYDVMDEAGIPLNATIEAPWKLTYKQLFFCNYVGNLTAIYDTEFLGKVNINAARKRQDWMLWLTILKRIKIAQPVRESLAIYRIRKNSISASKWDLIQYNFAIYRNFHRLNYVAAIGCMSWFLVTQIFIKPRYKKKIKA
ncbi:MAG: glycosyltransferase family 2 protein [Flavobacterium sp.]|nr:glycosyltransferase family 2 protein [Flavobacterium sp.]